MAKRKRIDPEYDQEHYDINGNGLIQRKRSSALKKFIIGILITVIVLGGLLTAGFFVGNYFYEQTTGVSLWTTFSVLGDFKDADEDEIVYNPFDSSVDTAGFYKTFNQNLYLKEDVDSQSLITNYMEELLLSVVGGSTEDDSYTEDDGYTEDDSYMEDGDIIASESTSDSDSDYEYDGGYEGDGDYEYDGEVEYDDSESSMPDVSALIELMSQENIDSDRLASYEGWQSDEKHADALVAYTDREFASFINEFIPSVIDSVLDSSLTYGIALSEVIQLRQIVVSNGSDMDNDDLDRLGANTEDDYITMTFSLGLAEAVTELVGSTLDESMVSSVSWVIDWLIPEMLYFTSTINLDDISVLPVSEINNLDHEEVEYEGVTMSKQDRVYSVIGSVLGGFGIEIDLENFIAQYVSTISSFLVRDEESLFTFGNLIVEDSVSAGDDGNEFKIDMLDFVLDMVGDSLTVDSSDFIVLLQAVLTPDVTNILADASGASVYESAASDIDTQTISQSSMVISTAEDYTDLDSLGVSDSDLSSLIDQYGETIILELAESYGIDTTYETEVTYVDEETGEEVTEIVEVGYTVDDIYGALGLGDETDASTQLIESIEVAVAEKEELYDFDPDTYEMPSITITDEMLCVVVQSQMETIDGGLSSYGAVFQKLGINKVTENEVEHDIVDLYFTIDIMGLLGDTDMCSMLGGLFDNTSMLVQLSVDITSDMDDTDKFDTEIYVNGLDGTSLNGLTSDYLFDIIGELTEFNTDEISETITDAVNDAFDSMNNSALVGITFAQSV